MAFPTTSILDNFNRPDEGPPPSTDWVQWGAATQLITDGNECTSELAIAGQNYWHASTGANCEVYVTVAQLPDDGDGLILVARNNGIVPAGPGSINYLLSIYRDDVGGDYALIISQIGLIAGPVFIVLSAGDSFGLECIGNAIKGYHKPVAGSWIQILGAVNSDAHGGGFIGLVLGDNSIHADDFGGGNSSGGVTPVPTSPHPASPSHHRSTGLSIIAEDPLLKATRGWSERLTDQIQTYRHEIRGIGGYWSAEVNINDRQDRIEDWIQNGLGRHITVWDDALVQCFEGFVNKITAKLGPLEFTIGPLMDIGNEVAYVYSVVDNSTNPPTMGARAKTLYADNLESQAQYGVVQVVQSVGGSTALLAAQYRDTFIAEHAWPSTSRHSTLLGGSPGDVTLEILGYWHWLTAYVYNQTVLSGEIGVSTKLIAVLAAQPNAGLFSTDYTRITPNAILVPQYENDDRTAEDIVKGLNSVGDASYQRMNCGFYNGRKFVYEAAAPEIRYVQRVTSNGAQTDLIGGPIDPWRVKPDGYIFYADFLAGRIPPATPTMLKTDPRCGRVEVVQYSAPYGLDVDGVPVGTLDQILARQGLAGMGA